MDADILTTDGNSGVVFADFCYTAEEIDRDGAGGKMGKGEETRDKGVGSTWGKETDCGGKAMRGIGLGRARGLKREG